MDKQYKQLQWIWRGWALLAVLLLGQGAAAQSGPVGNEWIQPGQQYYKVKISKDGLYKLDYQYLTRAGISGVTPSQLQVWRRGHEIATYVGGNQSTLDATTFLEFYAVHNDGRLDKELYRTAQDQPHQYYSFYTDTASYFITWSTTGAAGRRMAQPNATGGTVHPHRLTSQVNLKVNMYLDAPAVQNTYLPWQQAGEGFFGGGTQAVASDSVIRSVATTGPAPMVEAAFFGANTLAHATEVLVVLPNQTYTTARSLGVVRWTGRRLGKQTFQLQRSDVDAAGKVTIYFRLHSSAVPGDDYYASYLRIVAPQTSRWFANRRSVAFLNDSLLAGPATYDFSNDSIPATVVGFDVQDIDNVQRVLPTASSATTRRFVFPNANASATHRLLLADEAHPAVPPLPARRILFRSISPAVPNFIIITHPQLMQRDPATGIVDAPSAYAAYRASTAGGGYNTLVVTAPELYDQFTYGDRSWLALRHFGRWMAAATPTATNRYMLIIGKGVVPSEGGVYYRNNGEAGFNLIPTNSRSVSANMITADIDNSDFAAKINTGYLTAVSPAQVLTYLDKVKEHDLLRDEPWRKNILHLIGGENTDEFRIFRDDMNRYKTRAERPLFGGHVSTVERSTVTTPGTTLFLSTNIAAQLNPGLALITYLGHGSNTVFGLDIGRVSDVTQNPPYNNPGKYPILMYNGCAAGELFIGSSDTFFEDWLFTAHKGAIGALGETGLSYEQLLDPAQDTIYKLMFNDPNWYGKPVSAIYNEMVRRIQRPVTLSAGVSNPYHGTNDDRAVEQLLGTVWHGDPTISMYAPALPDFQVSNATVSIGPKVAGQTVTASSTSFLLAVGVSNPGKVTTDSVEIRVTRRYNASLPPIVVTKTFAQGPQGSGNYVFELFNPAGVNVFGSNTFLVEVDYRNHVAESIETNNTATINYTFLRGGVTQLNPIEFAIVGNNQPRLVAQTNDPKGASRGYEFEADTTAAFNSPLKRQSGPVTATLTPSWRPTLPATGRDSVVWYWRVRFQTPAGDEDGSWALSSFRVITGRTAGGWSQSHYTQFRRDTREGVEVAAPTGRWDFSTENKPLLLRTRGGGLPGAAGTFASGTGLGIIANILTPPGVADCAVTAPNLLVAVYDQHTLRPKTGLPAPFVCGQAPQQFYIFASTPANAGDTLTTLNSSVFRQGQLATFLAAVPDGDYVAIVSMNRLRWPSLTTVRTAFSTLLGSQLVNQLQNGDPFTILAQKRASGGRLIQEAGPVATGTVPRYSQTISLTDTLRTPTSTGKITSTRIGPAQSWENLYFWIKTAPGATSSYKLKITRIDTLGQATVLNANVPATAGHNGYSLSSVPASTYPYLQLELSMQDSVSRVAPQLKEWFITYRGVPEGVVRRDVAVAANATVYDPATLTAQASGGNVTFPVVFENVTPFNFGTPLRAKVELRDAAAPFAVRYTGTVTAPPLLADATISIPVTVPIASTGGRLFGNFTTKVTVNPTPHPLPEVNLFNNELNLDPFTVIDNNVPPTLDVAFDGRHILNGELVSPVPVINIQLNDEDKLRHITDPSVFTVTLLKPGATSPVLVNLTGTDVRFSVDATNGSVAKLTYEPGQSHPLADGMYTLHVQGRDPSNASAGAQDFQVKFEVVNASKITNVYPYPNPVINKARFVFTVTGTELPRDFKIQILTLTGRVVREIYKNELGPLHIGNNLTDFAWDGTDSFGDRLANGTYLYRVILDDPNGQFGHRDTAGDKAFKNDWGKLVLMR